MGILCRTISHQYYYVCSNWITQTTSRPCRQTSRLGSGPSAEQAILDLEPTDVGALNRMGIALIQQKQVAKSQESL